ncbi:hypothetical protein AVEN_82232-1 [Araneus ventricosus]|uniref:Uncharacterized protein n=1 Tax=Araneus ventricosus TaxID=182803 RepID=A0A4Y2VCJ8_ARAVE|nr:hypothetical protein AVEN_245349-1 [Araneus ventricosus]GBO22325.1 hypothetical protein AVEN_82232-1 [Araneus ventricosus]
MESQMATFPQPSLLSGLDLAPSDFHLFGPLEKHLVGHHFRTDTSRKPSLSGSATWILISSTPESIDWFTVGTNVSTTMVTKWKSNMHQCLFTFVYLFDFMNKPFLSENLLPFFLNHLCIYELVRMTVAYVTKLCNLS